MTAQELGEQPFNLLRRFAVLSLVSIALISVASSWVLQRYMRSHLIERDAVVSMDFIQSVATINDPRGYFHHREPAQKRQFEEFFQHITRLPDILRATVYTRDQTIIWSNDPELVGRRFLDNDELTEALAGKLVYEYQTVDAYQKIEHAFLPEDTTQFLENYIPVWDAEQNEVVGVIELYKRPTALFAALARGRNLIWASALVGGLFLYAVLFWIVWRGEYLIEKQKQALIESEKLAAMGTMVASVAHSIRNPLASVRSSAELALEETGGATRENLVDILAEVDRFDDWIRELLTFTSEINESDGSARVAEILAASIESFGDRPGRQGVRVKLSLPPQLPLVKGEAGVLEKVFNSLIANALEAMPNGGDLDLSAVLTERGVRVKVRDTGVGIPEERLAEVFRPLTSSKAHGLGVGLTLVRRVLEAYGGTIELDSTIGRGTTAQVGLQLARAA